MKIYGMNQPMRGDNKLIDELIDRIGRKDDDTVKTLMTTTFEN